MSDTPLTADEVIEILKLEPHPEGGLYRESFRDRVPDSRAHSTAIYYLLRAGQRSHWHRVDATEVWHYYAGAPLLLALAPPNGDAEDVMVLGSDLASGARPQIVAFAGWWQAAQTTGDWTLVGCTVAPGFEITGFEMAPEGWEPSNHGAVSF
jgi:predicted cupin superfamily sugar epimerase